MIQIVKSTFKTKRTYIYKMSTTLYLLCRNDDALSLIIRMYETQVVVPTLEQYDGKYIQHNTIHITVYEETRQKNK